MNTNYSRTILTGLSGKVNKTILDSVMGQLSDGKWENSPAMNKYWQHADIMVKNDQVVIEISDDWNGETSSGFQDMTADQIRNWFAAKIKAVVYDEMNGIQWSRDDEALLDYLSRSDCNVTVADAYRAYDILKGREIKMVNPLVAARKKAQAAKLIEIGHAEKIVAKLKAELAAL